MRYLFGRGARRRPNLGFGPELLRRLSFGALRRFLFEPLGLAAALLNFARNRRAITKIFLFPGVTCLAI